MLGVCSSDTYGMLIIGLIIAPLESVHWSRLFQGAII